MKGWQKEGRWKKLLGSRPRDEKGEGRNKGGETATADDYDSSPE